MCCNLMQSNCPSLSSNAVYRLTTHCGMGPDYHGVGVVFMNTLSLFLRFHPLPSIMMHDGNVILSPKFSGFKQVVSKLCFVFLLHFPFMLNYWNNCFMLL